MGSVRLLRWPDHRAERDWCRSQRVPRVLLVDFGAQPPPITDVYEDWVRPGVAPEDLQMRVQTVASRSRAFNRPQVDPNGDLVYQGQRVPISPTQAELAACLAQRFGDVVTRSALAACLAGDAGNAARRNVLDLHMGRLRRKITPLGLTIRTVWGCGYALEADPQAANG